MIALAHYSIISWDFDKTLIDHPKSPQFWEFIRKNPYGQQHFIITMRSHGLVKSIFPELEWAGSPLKPNDFAGVYALPDHIYESYIRLRGAEGHAYFLWKGETCNQVGAQVLIDDMEDTSISMAGCIKHGIQHIHPDDL